MSLCFYTEASGAGKSTGTGRDECGKVYDADVDTNNSSILFSYSYFAIDSFHLQKISNKHPYKQLHLYIKR